MKVRSGNKKKTHVRMNKICANTQSCLLCPYSCSIQLNLGELPLLSALKINVEHVFKIAFGTRGGKSETVG